METRKEKEMHVLRTVGYGNRNWNDFFLVLGSKSIELVIDVRRNPEQAWSGVFKTGHLTKALPKAGIEYLSLPDAGPTQGTLTTFKDSGNWRGFEQSYGIYLTSARGRAAVREIVAAVRSGERVVLLCSELRPDRCPRRLLAEHIASTNVDIEGRHI